MERVKLATIWFGGCAGCHMSFLDIDEFLIDVLDKVEIVYSPIVDTKEYPEGVDVCLIEGAGVVSQLVLSLRRRYVLAEGDSVDDVSR